MKGFTVPEHVSSLRVNFGSLGTIVLMVFVLIEMINFFSPDPSFPFYTAYLSSLALIVAAAAGFFFCWGLMLGFSRSRKDLRWLSLHFGILGAIAVAFVVSVIVFLGDSQEPAWKLQLIVAIAVATAFLLCWGLARLTAEMIGRPGNTQGPK